MDASLPWLDQADHAFPDTNLARRDPNGLLAAGGDLSPARLLRAYREGIFPWYEDPLPILWWSPDPRMVLYPAQFHLSRSLRKTIRSGAFEARVDTCFERVISHCAELRAEREGTWITAAMSSAYQQLHALGYAHSVEVFERGRLAGGLYGIALGSVFFGESMFSLRPNGSKIALFTLCALLGRRDFKLIDCQVPSAHLGTLGAVNVSRGAFIEALRQHAGEPDAPGRWTLPPSWKSLASAL